MMKEAIERHKRFIDLYKKYNEDTQFLSFLKKDHPAYLEIVAMGKPIVSLLLSRLWDSWLPVDALHDIFGEVPFEWDEKDNGNFDVICTKWYIWGVTYLNGNA